MKFVVISDMHHDAVTRGCERRDEIEGAIHQAIKHAIKIDAHLVFAGDLCDPEEGNSNLPAVSFAVGIAQSFRHQGRRRTSIWVAGNHDVVERTRGDVLSTLSPLGELGPGVVLFEEPGFFYLGEGVGFIGLPFTPNSARKHSAIELPLILNTPPVRECHTLIIVAHLSVPGIIPGTETTDMPRGREILLPVQSIVDFQAKHPTTRVVVVNGHYHRTMAHKVDGITVHIPGAPARLTFGEQENTPGFLVIDTGES